MDQVNQVMQYLIDTYWLFIIIEVIVIGVLWFFVRRWGREYKEWLASSEARMQTEQEKQLEERLIEGSRRHY